MGNRVDGKENEYHIKAVGEDQVAKTANSDTKLLVDVYNKLSKNGLNEEEKEVLKSLDKVLSGVELRVPSSGSALFVERHGNSEVDYVVIGSDAKQNVKPVKTR